VKRGLSRDSRVSWYCKEDGRGQGEGEWRRGERGGDQTLFPITVCFRQVRSVRVSINIDFTH